MTSDDLRWAHEHGIEMSADDMPTFPPTIEIGIELVAVHASYDKRSWVTWPRRYVWSIQLPCEYVARGINCTEKRMRRAMQRVAIGHLSAKHQL